MRVFQLPEFTLAANNSGTSEPKVLNLLLVILTPFFPTIETIRPVKMSSVEQEIENVILCNNLNLTVSVIAK